MAKNTTITSKQDISIYQFDLIFKSLLEDSVLPEKEQRQIKYMIEGFKILLNTNPQIAIPAYQFGAIVGCYLEKFDNDLLKLADEKLYRRRQSQNSKSKDGKPKTQPWQKLASRLAIEARKKYPSFSQRRVADYIIDNWPRDTKIPCVSEYSLKSYVSNLEKIKTIPMRQKKHKKS